jgi:ABC-type hemin transport system ATPase subunit
MVLTKEQKAEIAKNAIAAIGGPVLAAKKIQELSGRDCSRDRIQKWLVNGIPAPWHPYIHQLSDIPLHDLDPEIYPSYIFTDKERWPDNAA